MVLAKYPEMVRRIALKALASWLNMKAETLSRARRKYGRK
jgi:hypothetical protein